MSGDETGAEATSVADMMKLLIEENTPQERQEEHRKREEEFAAERNMVKEQLEALRSLVDRPSDIRYKRGDLPSAILFCG